MVYVKYKKHGIGIGHLWFTELIPEKNQPDILYIHGEKSGGYAIMYSIL